jgi:hypothetical protein
VDMAQHAIQLALASHQKELAAAIQNRLDRYRKSVPFREAATQPSAADTR